MSIRIGDNFVWTAIHHALHDTKARDVFELGLLEKEAFQRMRAEGLGAFHLFTDDVVKRMTQLWRIGSEEERATAEIHW